MTSFAADQINPQDLAQAASLDLLYSKLAPISMEAAWNKVTPSLWPEPRRNFLATHWRYSQAKAALDAAGRLINTDLAERRALQLVNPVKGNVYGTARTLVCAYQMIMPGERARSHRHTPNALRLVIDAGPGVYTTVNGEQVPMSPGDVMLTPNWAWHGHSNEGNSPAYWIDFLDVPLVHLLEPVFFEPHPQEYESGVPAPIDSALYYSWTETQRKLAEASAGLTERFGTCVELGKPALDTIALYMMRLAPKVQTRPLRTTANAIYAGVEGEGTLVVGEQRFAWERGDVIVVPMWTEHHHVTESGGVLFRVTDEPVMARLGFLREPAPTGNSI
jgi:gentisate 1,2-dioxygenase